MKDKKIEKIGYYVFSLYLKKGQQPHPSNKKLTELASLFLLC